MKLLLSMQSRSCHFYGHLVGWRRYEQYVKTAYCASLRKWFFYVYVPWVNRQLSLDVYL